MIKKFEVGKWYRYTGKKTFNWAPEMDVILDGKPRKVLSVGGMEHDLVVFSGVEGEGWFYGQTLKDWEKVPKPKNRIDLTKPQIVKKDVLIEVRNSDNQQWKKRYLLAVCGGEFLTWNSGYTGKQVNYNVSCCTRWEQARHIQPEPKKVTIELTEEQAEKVRKELGLGVNND